MRVLILLAICITSVQAQIAEIYSLQHQKVLTLTEFLAETNSDDLHILGDFHNTLEVQTAQAQLMEELISFHLLHAHFTLHWEFLNYQDQEHINSELIKYGKGTISGAEFLTTIAGKINLEYLPIIQKIHLYNGEIKGINLARSLKQIVVKNGIDALDSKYIPTNHKLGDQSYLERFKLAMGEHKPANIMNYFEAQCLTDSVMSFQINEHLQQTGQFVIAGSFHTDFYNGTVEKLKKLNSRHILTYKFVPLSKVTQEELIKIKSAHELYGQYADYIILTP